MKGLNTKRLLWTIFFLGVTLIAIVAEVVAGVWHPAGTIPWTEYIATYVPWPIQLIAYVTLAVWLPFHFYRADTKRKIAYKQGRTDATMEIAAAQARARAGELMDRLDRDPPPFKALLLPTEKI